MARAAGSAVSSGWGCSQPVVGGMIWDSRAIDALIRPAMPAAASVWPILALTEPTGSGRLRPVNTAARACISIGSPSAVPVPCASMQSTASGASPALARAARMTASWAGPLGAVRPALRPSWFTALPRITASTRSPAATAAGSSFSTTTPQPSPRT